MDYVKYYDHHKRRLLKVGFTPELADEAIRGASTYACGFCGKPNTPENSSFIIQRRFRLNLDKGHVWAQCMQCRIGIELVHNFKAYRHVPDW
jgi:hypothetical protein